MTRLRRGIDWGERSASWAGITSETIDVGGLRVHYLQSDVADVTPRDALPHLLIHPMGAGSWSWMDVIRPLSMSGRGRLDCR